MFSFPGRFLKILLLSIAIAWIFGLSIQSQDAEQRQTLRQISYTYESFEKRLYLLQKMAQVDEELVVCGKGLASAPLFDAWGRLARCSSTNQQITLISSGPDEEFNSADDIELNAILSPIANLSKND